MSETTYATLTEFLLAKIGVDEAVAREAAAAAPAPWEAAERGWMASLYCAGSDNRLIVLEQDALPPDAEKNPGGVIGFIAWFDPERVLAECAAKREIIEMQRAYSDPCTYLHGDTVTDCGGHPGPYMPHGDYGPGKCRRADEDNWTLRWLAAPYASHHGYNPEWAV